MSEVILPQFTVKKLFYRLDLIFGKWEHPVRVATSPCTHDLDNAGYKMENGKALISGFDVNICQMVLITPALPTPATRKNKDSGPALLGPTRYTTSPY